MVRGKGKSVSKNFKELLANSDSEFLSFLDKSENGKSVEKLSTKERENFWLLFIQIFKKYCEDEKSESITTVNNLLELLLNILTNSNFDIESENEFINLLSILNSNSFSLKDDSIVNNISLINEYWMSKKSEKIVPGMEYFTLKYLLEICSSEKPLVSDIQRLNAIRKCITSAPFESAVPSLRPLLVKLVQSQVVLNSENGQRFLAQALILSSRVMLDIHKTVLLELSSCIRKKASYYGKVYVGAWQNAKPEMRTLLEKTCFKHIMEAFLKEQRTSIELTKVGQNLLSVLDVWHSERKKKNADFITMITDCYQSFIWKYLESGFNVHRCNAADLLFKAFPLQRPGDNVMDAERLFNQQYSAMISTLRDDCHIVRIIAVREVCNILAHYWNSFTSVQIHTLLTIISKEDAHDASTADVRRMVYVGFQSFLNNPLSFEYLRQILPAMSDNIHDVNQKVRIAFIQLLIAIKEKGDPNLKYSDLVPTFSLYYRLAEENIKVGQLIVKLLMSSYYQDNMPVIEWTKRFIFLIKTYPKSYRNFFLYSERILSFPSALTIMYEILVQVGNYVLSKAEIDPVDIECDEEVQAKKVRRSKGKRPLTACNIGKNNEIVSKAEKTKGKECAFDDPLVVEGLFDIVTILWILHDNKLNKSENQEQRLKIYETYTKYAQPFINYYKDTCLFNSVLCLSGNIPSSLLRSNSITLPGYCMKMLKSNQIDSSVSGKESSLSMLVALIKWGKGSDVLDQVTLWLDAAFETQDLNATILPRRRVKISETIQPNSIVAIQILDTLMKTEYVKMSVLKKNYAQLFELWKFMSRIKKIIETRLEQGEPYEDELVSDTFIKICFKRYVKLIPLLKDQKGVEEEEQEEGDKEMCVNYQKEIEDLISWAEDVLYPYLQERTDIEPEDISLIASVYIDILYVADNMIILHVVNRQFYSKITHLILKLLDTQHGLRFVKAGSRIAAAINYSGKLLFNVNDDLKIFSRIVPCIVSNLLNVLTRKKLAIEDIALINADLGEVKGNLSKILDTYEDNFKLKTNSRETLRQLQTLIGIFLDSVVTWLSKELTPETRALPHYKTIGQMPPIVSSLVSLFYNRKFWTPMFIHVMNATLSAKVYDLRGLLSCIVLLNFYANNDKKMNKAELKKTIMSASNLLASAKSEAEECIDSDDSVSSAIVEPNGLTKSQDRLLIRALAEEGLTVLSKIESLLSETREEDE
ncbi:UNVERIFIED_CONTAM: hypothetical protein PYX00_006980 [Menopon gallinae]|uniref:Condensin-2 complex subunit G2 n=1 Tax=Menopon gallinae TaxID=328185 RepID=A0AAW2HH41_9NEOP